MSSDCMKALPQCAENSGCFLISVCENVSKSSTFIHSLYLIGLVPSMSFSFSLSFSSLIEVNSDNDFGSTLEAVAFLDMLA